MALWEYKVISSGKGGFATPALLEKFLNDIGRDEWEIIEFRSPPENPLAFTGLARRTTQRDWTLEDAAAAAAKVEAEKLRAEFAAKFQAATSPAPAPEEAPASFLQEKLAPDDGFRKPVDTSRDDDPDAPEDDSAEKDEWDKLSAEDELPSFFDALKPHMRRNQRGPGMSVGTDYLAKKWGLDEGDIKGALVECGLQIPADENAKPVYVEYDGDLYWVNINRRGEVWINTREKPRPVFRVVQATRVESTDEAKPEERRPRNEDRAPKPETVRPVAGETAGPQPEMPAPVRTEPAAAPSSGGALPQGADLLAKIRPLMRRNRRGPGGSGSASFLARALKTTEAELTQGFVAMGLVVPATPNDAVVNVEIAGDIWWLNKDSRGGLWINGREKRAGEDFKAPEPAASAAPVAESGIAPAATETAGTETIPSAPTGGAVEPAAGATSVPAEAAPSAEPANVLAGVRLLLKGTRTGSVAGKVERVAGELGKSPEELTAALVVAGLQVPEKAREKPVFVEHAGEIFWFNLNAKGELWVNAKASKFADQPEAAEGQAAEEAAGEKKPSRRGGRSRGRRSEGAGSPETPDTGGTAAP